MSGTLGTGTAIALTIHVTAPIARSPQPPTGSTAA